MSNFSTKSGLSFTINEDGTILQTGSINLGQYIPKQHTSRPVISKFNLSSNELICGNEVYVSWHLEDSSEAMMTIRQGSRMKEITVPDDGDFIIKSDISSDDIELELSAKNNIGVSTNRKYIKVSKRKNEVKVNVGKSILYWLVSIIFIISFLIKIISDIFGLF